MVSRIFSLCLAMLLAQVAPARDLAPQFRGTTINTGQQINLRDFRGKVVLVDFWASWCPPCLVSLPAYNRMRREIGTHEFEVIAINVDQSTEEGVQFLQDQPVDFPVLADPDGRIGTPFGVQSLPVSFLLDRESRIVASYKGFKVGDEVKLKLAITGLLEE